MQQLCQDCRGKGGGGLMFCEVIRLEGSMPLKIGTIVDYDSFNNCQILNIYLLYNKDVLALNDIHACRLEKLPCHLDEVFFVNTIYMYTKGSETDGKC